MIAKLIFGGLLTTIDSIMRSFTAGKISEQEARAKIEAAQADALARTEAAWADSAARQQESFQASVRNSVVLQRAVAALIIVQLMVLLFYQIGVPYMEFIGYAWPTPQIQLEWCYALLLGSVGLGALVRR